MSDDKVLAPRDLIRRLIFSGALLAYDELEEEVCALMTTPAQPSDGALINEGAEPAAWLYRRKDQSEYGEPSQHVALATKDIEECRTGKNVEGRVVLTPRDDYFDWKPLYVHPPVPASVVLPERMDVPLYRDMPVSAEKAMVWNACLDRVKELNS